MRLRVFSTLLLPGALLAQEVVSVEGRHQVRDGRGRSSAGTVLAPGQLERLPDAPEHRLAPLTPMTARRPLGANLIGQTREVDPAASREGVWTRLADGRWLWRWSIRSEGARALRLHFDDFASGDGRVWLYGGGSTPAQEYTASGPHGDGEFWTATVPGDTLMVEFAPAGRDRPDSLPFRMDRISHAWADAGPSQPESLHVAGIAPEVNLFAASGLGPGGREVAACHLDANCYPDWRTQATGVARIVYVSGQSLFSCSGALVNTRSGIGTPLFMTADHCINTAAQARTVEANFYYQTSACNAAESTVRIGETIRGGSYLASADFRKGDYSLIQLSGAPANAYFFGWSTAEPAAGAKVIGIHHPAGSYKRISFGFRAPDENFPLLNGKSVDLIFGEAYYQVRLTEGRIQGGSSGSPLINENRQIVGTLTSGPVYSEDRAEDEILLCKAEPFVVQYGRFTKAFPDLRFFLEDLRPARIVSPAAGEKLQGRSVRFFWTPGVGASEYVFSVGRAPGTSDLLHLSTGLELSAKIDNLPADGSTLYVRIATLLQGNWEFVDYIYQASPAPASRPAALIAPKPGDTLESAAATFVWDAGSAVDEFKLDVGTTPGGVEVAHVQAGAETSASITGLPTTGGIIYVAVWSRIGRDWHRRDYTVRAADLRPKAFALRVTNRLLYPVTVRVDGAASFPVAPSGTVEREIPGTASASVSWELVRPTVSGTGLPLGEAVGGTFPALSNPAGSIDLEVTSQSGNQRFFAPIVSNQSAASYLLEVNGVRCNCAISPKDAPIPLGYYRLTPASSVRGFMDFLGYAASPRTIPVTAAEVDPATGAIRLQF